MGTMSDDNNSGAHVSVDPKIFSANHAASFA